MLKVERVGIGSVSPDPANLRRHPEKNLAAIKASLRRFGQQKPIVVDEGGVVRAGNGTLAAAIELGWSEIDIVRSSLSGIDAVAYAIADNRTAELAEWATEDLGSVLSGLPEDYVNDLAFDDVDLPIPTTAEEVKDDATVVESVNAAILNQEPLKHGTVVRCGQITLVVACPTSELHLWREELEAATRFIPYPSIFAFLVPANIETATLMVQPDGEIAATAIAVARAKGFQPIIEDDGQ